VDGRKTGSAVLPDRSSRSPPTDTGARGPVSLFRCGRLHAAVRSVRRRSDCCIVRGTLDGPRSADHDAPGFV